MSQRKTESLLFVIGTADDGQGGHVVRPIDAPEFGEGAAYNLRPDMSEPLTRKRCAALLEEARTMTGRDLYRIVIHDCEYTVTPGNECGDFPEDCLRDKLYSYDARSGELIITDRGRVIYINDGTDILRGDDAEVAHADSLDV